MVGLPVLGLLGILDAGRGIRAPLAISGVWTLDAVPTARCGSGPSDPRQPALSISQSGAEALITLNDSQATTLEGTVSGAALTAKSAIASISASIAGKPSARTLEGTMQFDGCVPVAFRAARQAPQKRGD
jgi:hypothetical protein